MTHNKPDNRLGRFIITDEHLRGDWHNLLPMMGNFVVVQCAFDYAIRAHRYTAYSPLFDVIPEWSEAPTYELTLAMMPDGPAIIKAERQS